LHEIWATGRSISERQLAFHARSLSLEQRPLPPAPARWLQRRGARDAADLQLQARRDFSAANGSDPCIPCIPRASSTPGPLPLKAWHALAKASSWSHPKEIKAKFATASFLANNRVVFNICGKNYRHVVKVDYEFQAIFIRFIGSHAEHDKIDASSI